MNFVGLISGGKDSIYSIMKCLQQGHKLICLANLQPPKKFQELNSYMYQSVGAEVVQYIAQAIGKPLIQKKILGKAEKLDLDYEKTKGDEVEDLYELLKEVKEKYPEVEGVSSGAIMSTYQKLRVEDVCKRLKLNSLAPIWQFDQQQLLQEMVDNKVDAILVRVCTAGLDQKHLGKSIIELKDYLIKIKDKYQIHCCGEGGEFETIVLDCPIYKKRLKILEQKVVVENDKPFSFVGRIHFVKVELEDKL